MENNETWQEGENTFEVRYNNETRKHEMLVNGNLIPRVYHSKSMAINFLKLKVKTAEESNELMELLLKDALKESPSKHFGAEECLDNIKHSITRFFSERHLAIEMEGYIKMYGK